MKADVTKAMAVRYARTLWHAVNGKKTACGMRVRPKAQGYELRPLGEVDVGRTCSNCAGSRFMRELLKPVEKSKTWEERMAKPPKAEARP